MRVDIAGATTSARADTAFVSGMIAADLGGGLTLGGGLGFGDTDSDFGMMSYDGRFWQASAYLRKRPVEGAGLTWKLGVGYANHDLRVTRLATLANTEVGYGDSSIETKALFAEVGYELDTSGAVKITPYLSFARIVSKAGGYVEANDISFPIQYDPYETELTTASIGMQVNHRLTAKTSLAWDFGLESDLSRSNSAVSGNSLGFLTFSVNPYEVVNKQRIFAGLTVSRDLDANRRIEASFSVRQSAFSHDVSLGARIGYVARF